MDQATIDHVMHTFCHVKDSRRFSYGAHEAWLCHRCSGIYSSFLFFAVLAKITRWRGLWTQKGGTKQVFSSAGFLLGICGIQVYIQQFDGDSGGGPLARFAVGAGVGLALLQIALYQGSVGSNLKMSPTIKASSPWLFNLSLLPLGALHLWLQSQFFGYHLVTSLPGLLLMYFWINHLALGPYLKGPLGARTLGILFLIVLLEWSFLYYMNVGRYHV
jgi:hypothetical protein